MLQKRKEQKLVSFVDSPKEKQKIAEEIKQGWFLTSLVKNGSYFVGIMERKQSNDNQADNIYIPPRKKIKITN